MSTFTVHHRTTCRYTQLVCFREHTIAWPSLLDPSRQGRRRGLPRDPDDAHSRYLEASVGSLIVGCRYCPTAIRRQARRVNDQAPIVLCGDYFIVLTPIDAVGPSRWTFDAVYFPESRDAYAKLLGQGWTDALRQVQPKKGVYTYCDFAFRGGYDRSSGLQMDHLLLNPSVLPRCFEPGASTRIFVAGRSGAIPCWHGSS